VAVAIDEGGELTGHVDVVTQSAASSFALAFNDAFLVGAAIVGAGAIPALFLASKSKSRARGMAAPVEIVD